MTRYTTANIEAIAERVRLAAIKAGILPEHVVFALQKGSPSYGRAWRLHSLGDYRMTDADVAANRVNETDQRALDLLDRYPRGTGHYGLPFIASNGYLGVSSAEAHRTLVAILDTLWAVNDREV